MPAGILRVAVCQLECHPALTLDELDYLSEPTVPEPGGVSLSSLSRLSLDVADLQVQCGETYRQWHRQPGMLNYPCVFAGAGRHLAGSW